MIVVISNRGKGSNRSSGSGRATVASCCISCEIQSRSSSKEGRSSKKADRVLTPLDHMCPIFSFSRGC